jgi:hypothetical protein
MAVKQEDKEKMVAQAAQNFAMELVRIEEMFDFDLSVVDVSLDMQDGRSFEISVSATYGDDYVGSEDDFEVDFDDDDFDDEGNDGGHSGSIQ